MTGGPLSSSAEKWLRREEQRRIQAESSDLVEVGGPTADALDIAALLERIAVSLELIAERLKVKP